MRATNPPSNAALLDGLADHFRKSGYNQKKLLRAIMTSHVYGLSSLPNERNIGDLRNYSRTIANVCAAKCCSTPITDIT